MNGTSPFSLGRTARLLAIRPIKNPLFVCHQCRSIKVSASPTTETHDVGGGDAFGSPTISSSADLADARFEVLGTPYSLLSVSLSASQQLYTRRGTLAAVVGIPENVKSTLSLLNPLGRAPLGIPFLYQRISSTTPVTALIATKSAHTSFTVLHLDGTTDWIVSQRPALLAWTGHTLTASPRLQLGLSIAHWGNTLLTGRGLAALAAPGQTYQVTLAEGEEFVAHPSHVVAYALGRNLPSPAKLRGMSLFRLQIPGTGWLANVEWVRQIRESVFYKQLAKTLFTLRTLARTWIWGDGLFLQFKGPTTLLISSRGARLSEMLTSRQVNDIADSEAGVVSRVAERAEKSKTTTTTSGSEDGDSSPQVEMQPPTRNASLEEEKDLKEFVR